MPAALSPDAAQFVEDLGLMMEQNGHPRIAGRIIGWLLLSDPPHQSFGDLVEVLGASKGSISSMTRLLLEAGLIERFALPGERQTYFRIAPGAPARILRRQIRVVEEVSRIVERGLAIAEREAPETDAWRLREMRDFYRIASRRIPEFLAEYERDHPSAEG